MENATKALLISAGVLFTVMIASLLVYFYSQVSNYYSTEHNAKQLKQISDYNKFFTNYTRKNIRGNDMISLMNRVIDYNEKQSYEDDKKYPRLTFILNLGNNLEEYKYPADSTYRIYY